MRGEGTDVILRKFLFSNERGRFITCMYPGPSDGLLYVILADGTRLSGWLGSQLEGGPRKTARFQPPIAPLSATRGFLRKSLLERRVACARCGSGAADSGRGQARNFKLRRLLQRHRHRRSSSTTSRQTAIGPSPAVSTRAPRIARAPGGDKEVDGRKSQCCRATDSGSDRRRSCLALSCVEGGTLRRTLGVRHFRMEAVQTNDLSVLTAQACGRRVAFPCECQAVPSAGHRRCCI